MITCMFWIWFGANRGDDDDDGRWRSWRESTEESRGDDDDHPRSCDDNDDGRWRSWRVNTEESRGDDDDQRHWRSWRERTEESFGHDDEDDRRRSWRVFTEENRQEYAAWWAAHGQQWAEEQGVDEADIADYMPSFDSEDCED